MDVIKIGILGIAGVMLALQFKSEKQEYGIYIGIGVCLIVFSYCITRLSAVWEKIASFQQYINMGGSYFTILVKVIGITYVCEFCAAICKDAGYSAVAGQIEVFGKLTVLLTGLPILLAIIENINAIG